MSQSELLLRVADELVPLFTVPPRLSKRSLTKRQLDAWVERTAPLVDLHDELEREAERSARREARAARQADEALRSFVRKLSGRDRLQPNSVEAPEAAGRAAFAPAKVSATIEHASDFSWIQCPLGLFKFTTVKQREIVSFLFAEWSKGGGQDGQGLTEGAIGHERGGRTSRVRVRRTFKGCPALDRVLFKSGRDVWSLWLRSAPPATGR